MALDLLLALAGFAFVSSITPGPNNMMLLASGVNYGFLRSIPHMLGVGFGFVAMLLIVGLGLGQVIMGNPGVHLTLKVASVAYLLWLAWKIATSGPVAIDGAQGSSRPMTFLQAALFQWVNPKAWAMALTAVAAYTQPTNYMQSLLMVGIVFGLVNIPSNATWTGCGVALGRVLRDPRHVRIFNVTMAVLLVASIVPTLIERGH